MNKSRDLRGLDAIGMARAPSSSSLPGGTRLPPPSAPSGGGVRKPATAPPRGAVPAASAAQVAQAKAIAAKAMVAAQHASSVAAQVSRRYPKHGPAVAALGNALASRASRLMSSLAAHQRGIMGSVIGDDTGDQMAYLDSMTTLTNVVTAAGSLLVTLGAAIAQLQPTSQAVADGNALAARAQTIINFSQMWVDIQSTDPSAVAGAANTLSNNYGTLNNQASVWLAQAQSAGATSVPQNDSIYFQQAQAIVAQLTPIVAQLTTNGQTALAAAGQAIIDRANAVLSAQAENIRQQRGAM